MADLNSFFNQNSERKVLNPFKIEKKVFYPIVDISIIYSENIVYNAAIVPIAFVVEEYREKYIIYLNEKIDDNSLFSTVSAYKKDNKY